jgi:hypothetical protein
VLLLALSMCNHFADCQLNTKHTSSGGLLAYVGSKCTNCPGPEPVLSESECRQHTQNFDDEMKTKGGSKKAVN